ncbi:MAG: DUF4177 domain-containing protein [Planctomycetaceae bacterium]|nr:DUF4177 domain-containing protein [Planctomycetaceae bacterium]MBN8599873.1 DUF4177 domain-containing protein [Planctomycetota bacterium]
MQWEYRTERFDTECGFFSGTTFDTKEMNDALNALGREGWELVSVFDISKLKGGSKHVIAIFKRERPN